MKKARARKTKKVEPRKAAGKEKIADSYNRYKFFQGQQYTGMTIGRRHKWNYDKGIWIDKKITPEKWLINFEVMKRRAGHAPEGSGVPVGTEYHWYIMAHQMVKKEDANTYSTVMNGLKFKLAHKRAEKENWNAGDKAQRKHLIKILKDYIKELEDESIEDFIASEKDLTKSKTQLAAEAAKLKAQKKLLREKELMEA